MREALARTRSIAALGWIEGRIRTLSPGDRIIFFTLAGLVALVALLGLYALEQSLLVSVPAYGGTLTEGEIGSPRFINPLLAISDADRDLSALTYAGLMGLAGDGSLTPVLAESYSVSEGGKQYTFVLRQNAKFSDGTPVTAADVVFTVEKAQDPSLKSPGYANWSGVVAEAVDAHTVRFTLPKPYAPFLEVTTLGILPSRVWRNISDEEFPFSTLETNPMGAGPFVIAGVARDASGLIASVSLAANQYYAPGRPYLNGIRFVFYASSDDLLHALAGGTIGSAYGVPAGREESRLLTAPYARVFGVFWNPSEQKVFAALPVRKALSLAIDRAAIVKTILGGYATAIMGPVPPGGGVKQVPVSSPESPTQTAADILEAAGWKYDGIARIWKNAKATLAGITLKTSNIPELKSVASAVKSDWEKLGIPTTVELYEPGDLNQNVIRPRKYEALLFGEVIGRDQDLYAFWDSQERNDPGLNIALYANKAVDALLESARQDTEGATRAAALQKIEDTVAADYPAAFTHAPDFLYTVPKALGGVALPQITTPADRFASVASWYLVSERVWPFFSGTEHR
ncbi:peptide ABC transporter substrate-binding protein [Candidatus Kaiserbacteria bacterium]|nr:peptide ABC transporter substrate-binding protein [Candidatus Kaiserbacteria bacterium]